MDERRISMQYATNTTTDSQGESEVFSKFHKEDYEDPIHSDNEKLMSVSSKRHYGTHIPFFFVGRDPFLTVGPDWQYFLCMWTCMLTVGVLVNVYVATNLPVEARLFTELITFLHLSVYLLTALRNPGIASRAPNEVLDIEQLASNPSFCKKCRVMRSNSCYHCVDCDVCIKGFDHHCPWTGKCIGEGNLRLFYVFLASTMIFIVYCIIITCVVTATLTEHLKRGGNANAN